MRLAALGLLFSLEAPGQTPSLPDYASLEAGVAYDQYPQTVMDVVLPKTASRERRPGVVAIHGGGWVQGSKEAFLERVLPWVENGFVAANVEYRLAGVSPAPTAAIDVARATDFFRKNAKRWNVDPNRIVVTGGSAGGHLALITGLATKNAGLGSSPRVAAVVNFYGITDMEDIISGPNTRQFALKWLPAEDKRGDLARRLSPMTYVRKDVPPVLSIHGTADETVPYDHGVNLTKALRDAGADAEMISVSGGKHPLSMDHMNTVFPQVWEFLKRRGILK